MIITIQNLRWSNWFSYSEDNYIEFNEPVLQVMGSNGTGKTSIPIILQEVYFGKNSKGKKKAALPNRYLNAPLYAESDFIDDIGNKYKIKLYRKATLKLQLFKNGEDISSHTTTNTYKTIENILGLDFKTFSQLIYQSSTDNLEFLTATDTNRKKFLITLFSLNKYLSIQEKFKAVGTRLNTDLVAVTSKLSTIQSWIDRHKNEDLTKQIVQELPELSDDDVTLMGDIRSKLTNITETNKKINFNNTNRELLKGLNTKALYYSGEVDLQYKNQVLQDREKLKKEKIELETHLKLLSSKEVTINSLGDTCHACKQDIPPDMKEDMLEDILIDKISIKHKCQEIGDMLVNLEANMHNIREVQKKLKEKTDVSNELAKLTNSIDNSLPEQILDAVALKAELEAVSTKITKIKKDIANISRTNSLVSSHNSRIDVILEQLDSHKTDVNELSTKSILMSDVLSKVDIIKKAFSPSGLLNYKLDYLVKDLEKEINSYLSILSSGKFQLIFKLENEKLNIEIIDEGMPVGIEELSAGELTRINASTLLAIRKLMAAISSTKINILFLDEIMGVLDEVGKEVLIEVLHTEKDLNTLLVSHDYSHPLIPKVTIFKENNISRIEYD